MHTGGVLRSGASHAGMQGASESARSRVPNERYGAEHRPEPTGQSICHGACGSSEWRQGAARD
eukprot:4062621-Prymnesium_polylepis.1